MACSLSNLGKYQKRYFMLEPQISGIDEFSNFNWDRENKIDPDPSRADPDQLDLSDPDLAALINTLVSGM